MKIRLAIWFLLMSGVCALGLGNNGVPPWFSNAVDTWNPADKTANEILTNSNLTATANSNSTSGVRTKIGKTTGKLYFELTIGGSVTGNNTGGGITTAADTLGTALVTTSQGYHSATGGTQWFNTSTVGGNLGSWSSTNHGTFAVDFGGSLLWARRCTSANVCSNWNGNASANPATGTLGINIVARFPGTPAYVNVVANDQSSWLLNVGGTAFLETVPSGFSAWN